jgi:taurine--2-oxoglutarate transaminase
MADVRRYLLSRGLSTNIRWNILMVAPPLVITEAELRQGLAIIDEALAIADRAASS